MKRECLNICLKKMVCSLCDTFLNREKVIGCLEIGTIMSLSMFFKLFMTVKLNVLLLILLLDIQKHRLAVRRKTNAREFGVRISVVG